MERADGWARFLQGQISPFMCCGVLETKTPNHSVLCTKSPFEDVPETNFPCLKDMNFIPKKQSRS